MNRAVFAALAGGAILAASAAALAQGERAPDQPDGAALWRASCGYCHSGPMNAPELRGRQLPEAVIRQFVRYGAAGMPPFHPSALSEEELVELARWIAAEPAPQAQPQ